MVRLFVRFTAVVAVSLVLVAGGMRAVDATALAGPCGTTYPCLQLDDLHCYEIGDKCEVGFRFEGVADRPLRVHFTTEDGTARALEDYEPVRDGVLEVPVGAERGEIRLVVVADREPEQDEVFYVRADLEAEDWIGDEVVAEVTIVEPPAVPAVRAGR